MRKFRHDINGLRAIAVMVVVLFHFGVTGFNGGFIGVDIFFVISGYLMTSIIFGRVKENKFNLIDFYLARAKRIIPALVFMCLALLVVSYFTMIPSDYRTLGKHAASSVLFVSNFAYWLEAGYFNPESHSKWLLHTWSLSVEWQFYLVYPLIAYALSKINISVAKASVIVMLLLSLLFSYYFSPTKSEFSFFIIATRAWEMLIGGIVFLYPLKKFQENSFWIEKIGLGLIVISLVLFTPETTWPGVNALLPCIGCAFVIWANHESSIVTNNPVSSFLGKSSYSIYLWHWPVVVAIGYYNIEMSAIVIACGMLISVFLGYLSYRFIENPTREARASSGQIAQIVKYSFMTALVLGPASFIFIKNGLPSRVSAAVIDAQNANTDRNSYHDECLVISGLKSKECLIGGNGKDIGLILLGDSHSDASLTAVEKAIPANSGGVLFLGHQNCLTIPGVTIKSTVPGFQCGKYNALIAERLNSEFTDIPVLIINRTSAYIYGTREDGIDGVRKPLASFSGKDEKLSDDYLKSFAENYIGSVCAIAKHRKVYVTLPYPGFGFDVPSRVARDIMHTGHASDITIGVNEYYKRNGFVIKTMEQARDKCGITLLDPLPYLCKDGKCSGVSNGKSVYFDGTHLSEHGNKLLVPMFQKIFM